MGRSRPAAAPVVKGVLAALLFVSLALVAFAITACSEEPPSENTQASMTGQPCLAGIQVECACLDGSRGVQVCQPTGTAFSVCQCAGAAGVAGAMVPLGGASSASSTTGGIGGMVAGQSGGASGITASGTGGVSGVGTMAGEGGVAGMEVVTPMDATLAKDVKIAEIAIYQAVKVSLAAEGAAVIERNAPVIIGKDAFLRVFVEPLTGFAARDIEVVLTLRSSEGPAAPQMVTQRIQSASSDSELGSTVNFDIPGDQITEDLEYAVALHDVTAPAMGVVDPNARFPATAGELETLGPRDAGPLRVMLIPYRYQGDGSGRLPSMEQAQLDLFTQYLRSFYPASQIEVTVHEPVDYEAQVGPNTGWEQWLDFHCNLRATEDPDPKVLYYGVMSPRESLNAYGGGIVGISPVPSAAGNYGRCSVGVGFEGNVSASTMAHELGHSLGLPHAPCGVDGGPFPYAEASIGVWGYSLGAKALRDPDEYKDMMSYCDPAFISDYNFEKLFERIRYLNLQFKETPLAAPATYARVLVDARGHASLRGEVTLTRVPGGEEEIRTVRLLDARGHDLGSSVAYYFPFSEGRAGSWLVPVTAAVAVEIEGLGKVALR